MYSLSLETITQILDEVFYSFCFERGYLNLRIVNRTFDQIVLRIIFKNPFKYFKDKRLLVSLYIYYIEDLDNLRFLTTHVVDLRLITLSYLFTKKIDLVRFKKFANNTKDYTCLLKVFDYYEFICSFCLLCTTSNGIFPNINRFDLYPDKLEISLQYILKNNVLVDGVNLLTLNLYLETKNEEKMRLFWVYKSIKPFEKDEIKRLLNVKRVNIKVDIVDYDVMLILDKLDQVEKMEVEFLNYSSELENFVIYLKALINNYRKLKVLIFKNWKWNNITITFFSLFSLNSNYNNYNLKKIELINNRISVDKFWSFFNPDITTLLNCTIETWVMAKVAKEFYDKLIWNPKEKNYSTKNSK